jgi:hypothetical protein
LRIQIEKEKNEIEKYIKLAAKDWKQAEIDQRWVQKALAEQIEETDLANYIASLTSHLHSNDFLWFTNLYTLS